MVTFHHTALAHVKAGWQKHKTVILLGSITVVLFSGLIVGGSMAYLVTYEDRIYPNVTVGTMAVGGLTSPEAVELLQRAHAAMLDRGLVVEVEGREEKLDLRATGSADQDLAYDLIDFNADAAVQQAMLQGRGATNYWQAAFESLKVAVLGVKLPADFTINSPKITDSIHAVFADLETPSSPTDFNVTIKRDAVTVEVVPPVHGRTIQVEDIIASLQTDVADFSLNTLKLGLVDTSNEVTVAEAEGLIETVITAIEAAPYTVTYTADNGHVDTWQISDDQIADWILPEHTDSIPNSPVKLILERERMQTWIEELHAAIDVAPTNARFAINGSVVSEFVGSRDGVTVNNEELIRALESELGLEKSIIDVTVSRVEPEIQTGNVNNLGIKEVLGVGVSDFKNSPSNRIKNIKHGADKLNGLLIAPGETMSLLQKLQPFTVADGYLPELVIKGDEIKPEVGGGLCQIGTTTFRAVMNSGLEVVERRNHSLVVSYYNDPSNGKPGTDATIYDPAPDFKFKNNTANYILLTTEMDMENRELHFTFWGTSDGRKGYYTPPTVLSWSGYGEAVRKETTTLPPGKESCQAPHPGATTTFDYYVDYADGSQFTQNFTSTYRSLPKICLVGIDPNAVPAPDPTAPPATETTDIPVVPVESTEPNPVE